MCSDEDETLDAPDSSEDTAPKTMRAAYVLPSTSGDEAMFSDLIKATKKPATKASDSDKRRLDALLNELFEGTREEEPTKKGGAMAWKRTSDSDKTREELTRKGADYMSADEDEEPTKEAKMESANGMSKGDEVSRNKAEEEGEEMESAEERAEEEGEEMESAEDEGAEEEGAMSREEMIERVEAMLGRLSDEELSEFLSSREVKKSLALSVIERLDMSAMSQLVSPDEANGAQGAERA